MKDDDMIDRALALLSGDMDDLEGSGAMQHTLDECPDPLGCKMHEDEKADPLSTLDEPSVTVTIGKGLPTLGVPGDKGEDEKAEDGLSPEDAEELRKLLK